MLETNPPPPPPVPPQPRFVQRNYATPQTPQDEVSLTYPSGQTPHNANILAIGWNDVTANITGVSDSAGNVYQIALPVFRGNGLSQAIYYAADIKVGNNTVTVTFSQPAVYVDLRATEYSGLTPTNAFDVGASSTGISTSASSGPVAIGATNELLLGAGMTFTTPGSGFMQRVITSPDADIVEDKVAPTVGAYSATATLSSGAWLMQLAAFKPALPVPPPLRIFLTATNSAVLAWPANSTGFILQQNGNLSDTNWVDVTNAPVAPLHFEPRRSRAQERWRFRAENLRAGRRKCFVPTSRLRQIARLPVGR